MIDIILLWIWSLVLAFVIIQHVFEIDLTLAVKSIVSLLQPSVDNTLDTRGGVNDAIDKLELMELTQKYVLILSQSQVGDKVNATELAKLVLSLDAFQKAKNVRISENALDKVSALFGYVSVRRLSDLKREASLLIRKSRYHILRLLAALEQMQVNDGRDVSDEQSQIEYQYPARLDSPISIADKKDLDHFESCCSTSDDTSDQADKDYSHLNLYKIDDMKIID
ncbi:hypothetical protein MIR68_000926 [Amoeboaphelidium protococcarum]|nr:hypothetical protein MIR68_000926 [Amoeboaphelidium protococcarum]